MTRATLEAAIHAVADQEGRTGGFEPTIAVEPAAAGVHDGLLLSVARELLANAARHAAAEHVDVAVRREDGQLVLEVADDGTGLADDRLAEARAHGRIGLASSIERVEAVGGSLSISPAPGGGTLVRATVPKMPGAKTDRESGIPRVDGGVDGQ